MKTFYSLLFALIAGLMFTSDMVASDEVLEAPVLISPGTTTTNPATFTWRSVNGSTWYQLWVNKSKNVAFKQWYESADICSGGICSATIGSDLTNGDHTFWVKGWNDNGPGLWSDGTVFSVLSDESPPVVATPGTPDGNTENAITYTWTAVSNSTWYKLFIWDDTQTRVYSKWYEASLICSGGTCSVADIQDLVNGSYEWFLKSWNSYGPGLWSDGVSFSVSSSATPVTGEYGDAPDGTSTGYPGTFAQTGGFPTRHASNGARTLSVDDAVLGTTASLEFDADDPGDPDGTANLASSNTDSDDAITDFFLTLTSIPPPAAIGVNVSGPDGGVGGTYYLNILIDLDMDGSWGGTASGGEAEWVVKNYAVPVTPGATTSVTPPAFAYANGLQLPDGAWMRIALTREIITASDWDGSGEFSSGEIEDHVITLPRIDGKDHPILVVDCGGPYLYDGAAFPPVTCNVTNLRTIAGTFDWTIKKLSGGGVDVNAKSGGPLAIAAGPGATTAVGLTATRIAGSLPSTWKFTAVPDPDAVVTDEGVILGHGESAGEVEFQGDEEPVLPEVWVTGIEAGFTHFDTFSEISGVVSLQSDRTGFFEISSLEGFFETEIQLLRNGVVISTTYRDISISGFSPFQFNISQYGTYEIRVNHIYTGGNLNRPFFWDEAKDVMNPTTIVVN